MNTSALSLPAPASGASAAVRHPGPAGTLLSLMKHYERGEGVDDQEETETELMVLLSGMVGLDPGALDGE